MLTGIGFVTVDSTAQVVIKEQVEIRGSADKSEIQHNESGSTSAQTYSSAQQSSNPFAQREVETGVYAMWAADANRDGQVTATDFNFWLEQTKAVTVGYVQGDFNLDRQVIASDFNTWLYTTIQAPEATYGVDSGFLVFDVHAPTVPAPAKSELGTETTSKSTWAEDLDVKYVVTGQSAGGYLTVAVRVKTDPGIIDTLGSGVFDFYYNQDQLVYSHAQEYTHFPEGGYLFEVRDASNEFGGRIRVQIRTNDPDTVSYELDPPWGANLFRLRFFEKDDPITSHGIAFDLASLSVGIIEAGKVEDYPPIIPVYNDQFQY